MLLLRVYACQERNVAMELDLARAAVETVVRQLAAVSKTNQVGLAPLTASFYASLHTDSR